MTSERTFIAIKPDGVQRGLVYTLYSYYIFFLIIPLFVILRSVKSLFVSNEKDISYPP